MIKVIASDMDGTLLNNDHKLDNITYDAINKACESGIRFMIVTGRNYNGAIQPLKHFDLECDYILSSGAELRNFKKNLIKRLPMNYIKCRKVMESLKDFPVSVTISTNEHDYRVGTKEEIEESILQEIKLFYLNLDEDEIKNTKLYKQITSNIIPITDFDVLEEKQIPVYKLFIFSSDEKMLALLSEELNKLKDIAVASSFTTNLEITDIKAQKGLVLKEYIESNGYSMDEVMVLGDSMNDYSMLSMDFGATVAMENGMDKVKEVSNYITKSNEDHGVAYAISLLLNDNLDIIKK
jgi:Cof subfamily protein (haloacid dehalogenase superfamily)